MKKDIEKKLESLLKNIDKNKINSGKKAIEQLLSTEDGKKLAGQLNNIDKSKLIDAFLSMDSSTLKSKLENADLSKLSKIDPNEILKKMR